MAGYEPGRAAPAQATPPARRFAGLDGLRALAVVAVLCYHALPGLPNAGFLGVDVFFVLSGFLITSLIIDQQQRGHFRLRDFWDRRLRRIVPAVVVLLLGISAVVIWLDHDLLVGFGRQVIGSLTFSYNWLDIASSTSYFNHFQPELFRNLWSLAVEMQFYLVWPLLLIPLLRVLPLPWAAIPVWLAAAVSVGLAAWQYTPGLDPTRVYFGSDTHCFGLLLGAGLAALVASLQNWRLREARPVRPLANALFMLLGAAAMAGIVAAICLLDDTMPMVYPWGLLGASALACVVVLAASVNGSWLGKVLDVAPLRWVGERSYGVYLWHWPVAVILAAAVPWPDDIPVMTRDVTTLVGSLALSIAAAAVSYRLVEAPVRSRGWLVYAKSRVMWVAAALGTAALVACLVVAPATSETQQLIEEGSTQQGVGQSPSASQTPLKWPPLTLELTPSPKPMPTGDQIFALGDSVMLGCADALQKQFPGITVNAAVSRSFIAGLDILEAARNNHTLRPVVLLGLFTNGRVDEDDLERLMRVTSRDTVFVLITAYGDRSWIPPTNKAVRQFVSEHPRNFVLADWDTAIKGHESWLAPDGIHPRQDGRVVYVQTVLEALQFHFRG